MFEANKEINLENKNPLFSEDNKINLKKNLTVKIDKDNNDNKSGEVNKNNEETAMSEHEDEEGNQLNDIICIKDNKKAKIFDIIDEENYQYDDDIEIDKDEKENLFRSSKINRDSFQKIVNEDNTKIDDKKETLVINKVLLKKFMIVIEIILGSLLASSSIILIIIITKEKIIKQKILGIIIEPLIILISLLGMNPCKNKTYKKILLALYVWEGLFLFPFSFYIKASITDDYYNFFDIITKLRIYILSAQFINYILSLVFKINI